MKTLNRTIEILKDKGYDQIGFSIPLMFGVNCYEYFEGHNFDLSIKHISKSDKIDIINVFKKK